MIKQLSTRVNFRCVTRILTQFRGQSSKTQPQNALDTCDPLVQKQRRQKYISRIQLTPANFAMNVVCYKPALEKDLGRQGDSFFTIVRQAVYLKWKKEGTGHLLRQQEGGWNRATIWLGGKDIF